jgi:hypothetical protein
MRTGKQASQTDDAQDRAQDVRVFLAALAAGKTVHAALKIASLSERRVASWIAFNGFGPAAKRLGVRDGSLRRFRSATMICPV